MKKGLLIDDGEKLLQALKKHHKLKISFSVRNEFFNC